MALERYCLGRVTDAGELKALEIHFAQCPHCEHRIAETCLYIDTVRLACKALEEN